MQHARGVNAPATFYQPAVLTSLHWLQAGRVPHQQLPCRCLLRGGGDGLPAGRQLGPAAHQPTEHRPRCMLRLGHSCCSWHHWGHHRCRQNGGRGGRRCRLCSRSCLGSGNRCLLLLHAAQPRRQGGGQQRPGTLAALGQLARLGNGLQRRQRRKGGGRRRWRWRRHLAAKAAAQSIGRCAAHWDAWLALRHKDWPRLLLQLRREWVGRARHAALLHRQRRQQRRRGRRCRRRGRRWRGRWQRGGEISPGVC